MSTFILQRCYSIQSGKPDHATGSLSQELKNRAKIGAIGGGVLGGIAGSLAGIVADKKSTKERLALAGGVTAGFALVGVIGNCLGALGADYRRAKASKLTMDTILDILYDTVRKNDIAVKDNSTGFNIARYIKEDADPEKFMVTFAFEDGKGVIYLNKPTSPVLEFFNDELEDMIKFNRKADYAATKTKDGYIVEFICPNSDTVSDFIYDFISEFELPVCCLTTKTLNRKK